MDVKYMGSSDARVLNKGTDFGGQLGKDHVLDRDIVWSWDNNHVISTDDYDSVSDEFWTLLLEYEGPDGKEFKDVTGMSRVPTNAAQQVWRGMKKTEAGDSEVSSAASDDGEGARNESGTAETDTTDPDDAGGVSEATDTGAPTTTTGGSTSGRPRGRTRS